MCVSRWFEMLILGVILVNTGIMAATWYGQPIRLVHALETANMVFSAFYCLEAAVKVGAPVLCASACPHGP
jgi:hypothetical protein